MSTVQELSSMAEVLKEELEGLSCPPTTAELVGSWLWVTWDRIPPRNVLEELKKLGLRWSPKHLKWFMPLGIRKFPKGIKASGWTYGKIVSKYGVESIINVTA